MNKRLRSVFVIAALTATGIIACQLYWVYYNYRTARANFVDRVTFILRESIDSCQVQQNTLPASLLNEQQPSLTIMTTKVENRDSTTVDTASGRKEPTYNIRMYTVAVSPDQLSNVKALVARLLSLQANRPLNIDTLTQIFQAQLRRSGIREEFRLQMEDSKRDIAPGEIAAAVNFSSKHVIVRAELKHPGVFLFRQNFVPALVSTLLILLSAGSLLYMGRIIRRQMQLDSMKTDFMNNVIHELRTPLTILKSSNDALGSFGAAQDEASLTRYLGINSLVIDDLDKNIERILDFSRSEQGKRQPEPEKLDLVPLLKQAQLRFGQVLQARITLELSEDPFVVLTDPFMLSIIISNLLDNAIKYSPGEAVIRVVAGKGETTWQLVVADQGMGIPAHALPFIFDKFYRVPTGDLHEIKGYGIGLAYVKQLVTDLQGIIEVESEPGKGTVFTLTFNA